MLDLALVRNIVFFYIVITMILSVVFSIRYRRQTDPKKRGLNQAIMNVCMGLMLIGLAATQFFLYKLYNVRVIFGSICLLLGLFNIFAGSRNYAYFRLSDERRQ